LNARLNSSGVIIRISRASARASLPAIAFRGANAGSVSS